MHVVESIELYDPQIVVRIPDYDNVGLDEGMMKVLDPLGLPITKVMADTKENGDLYFRVFFKSEGGVTLRRDYTYHGSFCVEWDTGEGYAKE